MVPHPLEHVIQAIPAHQVVQFALLVRVAHIKLQLEMQRAQLAPQIIQAAEALLREYATLDLPHRTTA